MDDRLLQESKKKLAGLDRQLADLTTKQRHVEARLANEHDCIRKAASQRASVVSQLVDAPEQTAAKLHKQLDSLDQQIRACERQAEALQHALKEIASQTATLAAEQAKLNEVVGVEVNQREFQAWTITMEQNFKAATAALEAARLTLGRLTVEAAIGIEKFKGSASNWTSSRFDEFEHRENNPLELGGYKMALPWFRNVRFVISPMEKR